MKITLVDLSAGKGKLRQELFRENCRKEYYQEGNHVYGQLNVEDAINKALLTWSHWVDTHVDPKKTTVFFRGYSPSHFK